MKSAVFAFLFACLLSTRSSAVTTLFSNIGQSGTGGITYDNPWIYASPFISSASLTTISQVQFYITNSDGISHTITPILYADNGGSPGTELGAFSPTTIANSGTLTLASATGANINLNPSGEYWIGFQLNQAEQTFGTAVLSDTSSNSTDSGSVFTTVSSPNVDLSSNGGTSWGVNGVGVNLRYTLVGTPEPSRVFLILFGLGTIVFFRRRNLV